MIPRLGAPRHPNRKYRLRPGVYAILPLPRGLLVTLQTEPNVDLQLPGGGIDPHETPLQALHREVLEETGWTIAAPRRIGAYRRYTYMPEYDLWAEKLCAIYLARPVRHLRHPTEPAHTPMLVDPREAAESLSSAGDRQFVRTTLDL